MAPHPEAMLPHGPRAPLRLLLAAGGDTIPAWLARCVQELEHSGVAQVVLVVRAVPGEGQHVSSVLGKVRQVLFWLHQAMDRRLFRRSPDALAPIPVRYALPNRPVCDGVELRADRIDVVLDPFSLLPEEYFADLPTYGIWTITFGQSGDSKTQSTPAFWEVIEGRPSTETRLCIQRKGVDRKVALYVSVAPTDHRSVSRSQNHIYWKVSAAVARKLQMLWEDPDAFLERLKESAPFDAARRPSLVPGNAAMLRAGAALVRRYVSDKWRNARYHEQWALAYYQGVDAPFQLENLQTWMPPLDRSWADPFPMRVGNEYYIFHEELLFATGKGSIVLTVVDDKAKPVARCVPVLETDCHLSYPLVFQWDGDFFMIPETASRHRVELYRCIRFPGEWKLERVLLSDVRAFDATPALMFGKWWLFANVAPYGAGIMDELHLFHADSPLGPWIPHRDNPVKSDVRAARPAGRIFENDGQFYRPAQDCSKHYGYAVSINRIVQLGPEVFEEVEVEKIVPKWGPEVEGVHTVNVAGNLTVIDCAVRRKKSWRGSRAS